MSTGRKKPPLNPFLSRTHWLVVIIGVYTLDFPLSLTRVFWLSCIIMMVMLVLPLVSILLTVVVVLSVDLL